MRSRPARAWRARSPARPTGASRGAKPTRAPPVASTSRTRTTRAERAASLAVRPRPASRAECVASSGGVDIDAEPAVHRRVLPRGAHDRPQERGLLEDGLAVRVADQVHVLRHGRGQDLAAKPGRAWLSRQTHPSATRQLPRLQDVRSEHELPRGGRVRRRELRDRERGRLLRQDRRRRRGHGRSVRGDVERFDHHGHDRRRI